MTPYDEVKLPPTLDDELMVQIAPALRAARASRRAQEDKWQGLSSIESALSHRIAFQIDMPKYQ